MTGVRISRRSTKSRALARYSPWISRALASRPLARRTLRLAGDVVGDLADRADRVLEGEVAHHDALLDHPQHQVAAGDLEHRGRLAHVGVADDDVQPAVLLGVGVRLVAGVDDRPAARRGAADALPDVLGALADGVGRAARRLGDLAGAHHDLPGHQERDQHVRQPAELPRPADQVVLVAAVGVAGGVGVVLEQVDLAGDALVVQPLLGVEQQPLEHPLPRLVVGDQLGDVVALRRGVLGVAADVEVEPGAVAQEDVARPAPADDLAEQVAGDLVGTQPALPLERARDAVLVLDAEDPPVHGAQPRRVVSGAGPAEPPLRVADWSPTAQIRAEIMPFATNRRCPSVVSTGSSLGVDLARPYSELSTSLRQRRSRSTRCGRFRSRSISCMSTDRVVEQVVERVAASVVRRLREPTTAAQVDALLDALAVVGAVVLVKDPGADDGKIGVADVIACLVVQGRPAARRRHPCTGRTCGAPTRRRTPPGPWTASRPPVAPGLPGVSTSGARPSPARPHVRGGGLNRRGSPCRARPRSRAARSRISSAGSTGRPPTASGLMDRSSLEHTRPWRRGRLSFRATAAKTGTCSGKLGSCQPRRRAPVTWV